MGTVYRRVDSKGRTTWYINYSVEGRRYREAVGPDRRLAEEALKARLGEIAQGRFGLKSPLKSPRLRDFALEYLEYARANKRSWRRDETSLRHLVGYLGDYRLSAISPWVVEKYKALRRGQILERPKYQEKSPEEVPLATINRELATLKHLSTKAVEWGRMSENPVKRVKLFREQGRRPVFLSEEEAGALIGAAADHLKPLLITALNTGMRLGELLCLRWEQVDFRRGEILIERSKGGEPREVPMNRVLTETLRALYLSRQGEYVFGREAGHQPKSVRTGFQAALRRSGIRKKMVFHSLRHTFASHLVMAGVDLKTVQELLGHASITTTMIYAHLARPHKQQAVERLAFGQKRHLDVTSLPQASGSSLVTP